MVVVVDVVVVLVVVEIEVETVETNIVVVDNVGIDDVGEKVAGVVSLSITSMFSESVNHRTSVVSNKRIIIVIVKSENIFCFLFSQLMKPIS